MRGDQVAAFAAVVYGGLGADARLPSLLVLGSMTNPVVEILVPVSEDVKVRIVDSGNFPGDRSGFRENC